MIRRFLPESLLREDDVDILRDSAVACRRSIWITRE
ncbi:hypothetical protein AALP_AA8G147700 [Arabis alpina]|uniref:Uncharacterized protein n=1 Tax=Arabis alpina TaxID=50452 RepID=A0A087G748_ARAAL|nr:hypothetical protein AALP_AA8G147700 [Arabis alpina]